MKHLTAVLIVLFVSVSLAWADDLQGLSVQDRDRVQREVREMSAVGVPEAQARAMLAAMARNRFSAASREQARQAVMNAARDGLPCAPLMEKAMEGMTKRAGEQQVVRAMATVRDRWAEADRLARRMTTDRRAVAAMRQAVADSLAAGMRVGDVEAIQARLQVRIRDQERILNRAEADQLAVQTMQTVRTMARLGIDSSQVAGRVNQGLRDGYTRRDMERLHQQMASPSRAGAASAAGAGGQGAAGGSGGSGGKSGGPSGGPGGGPGGGGGGGRGGGR